MWSETVGLGQDRSETKKSVYRLGLGLGLAGLVLCCIGKHSLVTLVVVMILKDTATFQVLFYSCSILCLGRHCCGDQQWRSHT